MGSSDTSSKLSGINVSTQKPIFYISKMNILDYIGFLDVWKFTHQAPNQRYSKIVGNRPEMTGDELPIQDAQDLLPGTRSTGTGSTLVVGSPGQCHGQPGPWRSTGLACSSGY